MITGLYMCVFLDSKTFFSWQQEEAASIFWLNLLSTKALNIYIFIMYIWNCMPETRFLIIFGIVNKVSSKS